MMSEEVSDRRDHPGTNLSSPTRKAMAEVQAKKSEKGSDAVRTKAGHEQFCFEERASCCSRMFLGWFTIIILNSKKKYWRRKTSGR